MAHIYGRDYSKQELLQRVDDMSQLAGVRASRLQNGPEDGTQVLDFWTGSGLRFTVVPSRGMDISWAEYRGKAICPRATCRETHPSFFEPGLQGWRRGFFEGMLTTCGPTFFTEPPRQNELRSIQHGRAAYAPARNVCYDEVWQGDEYLLWTSGRMREAALVWERRISTSLGAEALTIVDRVENQGASPINHRFQYHINAGFPVVDEGSEFIGTSLGIYNRQGEAVSPEYHRMQAPSFDSQTAAHDELMIADDEGYALAALINPDCEGSESYGYYLRYRLATLPYFFLWKCLTPDRYIVGTEPASHIPVNPFDPQVEGRERLDPLMPGEERVYEIEIGVIPSTAVAQQVRSRVSAIVDSFLGLPARPARRIGTTSWGRHGF